MAGSQMIAPLSPPVASLVPSGLQATDCTCWSGVVSSRDCSPVSGFQMSVPLNPPVASLVPSGFQAADHGALARRRSVRGTVRRSPFSDQRAAKPAGGELGSVRVPGH